MQTKVSIIVPVYNAETFLTYCFQSIVSQTFDNLEVILVDDGSSDKSAAMCDGFAQDDSRVIVIHKQNGGANSARSIGLDTATGKYVAFVDSDDWLDPDMIQRLVQTAERDHADCVLCSYTKEYRNGSVEHFLFPKDFCYDAEDAETHIHQRLIGPDAQGLQHPERIDNLSTTWGKLYRREVACRGLFANEREVGYTEDTLFNIYALDGCSRISYVHACLYHYRKFTSGSMTTGYRHNLPDKYENFFLFIEKYIQETGKTRYTTLLQNRIACSMITLGLNEVNSPLRIHEKIERIRLILNRLCYKQSFQALDRTLCPVHWKVFFTLCKHRCALILWMMLASIEFLRTSKNGIGKGNL